MYACFTSFLLCNSVIPAIGFFCSGGHCVIVSMKPTATVAKVVNPLGTVVTVQSDDDTEEVVEDAVIHENCDEALFRPVVAPKAIFYSETKPKPCPPDHILTKSLEANTEVAVKIINYKTNEKNNRLSSKHIKSRECSPKTKIKDNKIIKTNQDMVQSKSELRSKTKEKKKEEKAQGEYFNIQVPEKRYHRAC